MWAAEGAVRIHKKKKPPRLWLPPVHALKRVWVVVATTKCTLATSGECEEKEAVLLGQSKGQSSWFPKRGAERAPQALLALPLRAVGCGRGTPCFKGPHPFGEIASW